VAAAFEDGERFLLPGLQNMIWIGRCPAIRQKFAEGGFVGGKHRGETMKDVGEIGGHVEMVEPGAPDHGVERGGGAAAGETAEEQKFFLPRAGPRSKRSSKPVSSSMRPSSRNSSNSTRRLSDQ
jgi:hypothetical protein